LILRRNLNKLLSIFEDMNWFGTKKADAGATSLADAPRGQKVRVSRLEGQPSMCNRLREMGFCEEAEVCVLNAGGTLVCQVCGSKVGLSRCLAESIHVEPSVA
jgi:Fe2+ transport system protein FeoA